MNSPFASTVVEQLVLRKALTYRDIITKPQPTN